MAVLRIGSYQFRLNPFALVITLLAIAMMIKLGFWQIDRGQEKQALIDQHAQASALEFEPVTPTNLASLSTRPDQPVTVTTELDQERYFLVENQIYQGRVGYHVIALAPLTHWESTWVPVNFGWVPASISRTENPDVQLPSGEIALAGRIHVPEAPFLLREQELTGEWPQRLQYPELNKMAEVIDGTLAPFVVRLTPEGEHGFVREWPVVTMEPHRHYAYALQWFGLAFAAAVVFLVASRKRGRSVQAEEDS
ncbi:MAG: SURF1 family protein [Idiomarina sp.]|nr:SURF1 family protein [Idiomarina sp.]